ncbi:hypothetical protein TNCT_378551 [Trichonephila clavata]|uniref:Uncharacterized protein n=1 Tax=Trichonephila clavata TaxID=2740835 RepID=A0A8X6LAG3_TRICU|nr:hypothetical protein TNCT_378551 [Trichonephila clavata]
MLRELHIKTADANLKKNKESGIICNCNLQQFEIICYESIDILQAPDSSTIHLPTLIPTILSVGRRERFSTLGSEGNISLKHLSNLHGLKTIEIKMKIVKPFRKSRKTIKFIRSCNENLCKRHKTELPVSLQ